MDITPSLIPELEQIIQHGTRAKRVTRCGALLLFSLMAPASTGTSTWICAMKFRMLIEEIETKARTELSNRLAPVSNAPVKVLRTLANDDDIAVAGPVLTLAPRLEEADLINVANTKSQADLQAISARPALGEAVTDVLVRRGGREVAHGVAGNPAPVFLQMALSAWSSAPMAMASWPRRWACGRTFRSRCSASC